MVNNATCQSQQLSPLAGIWNQKLELSAGNLCNVVRFSTFQLKFKNTDNIFTEFETV
jgi:hypothetical protein